MALATDEGAAPANQAPVWTEVAAVPLGFPAGTLGSTEKHFKGLASEYSFSDIDLPDCGKWTVLSTARAAHTEIKAIFDSGWILKPASVPFDTILKHEQLHWTMTEYIASLFTAIAKSQFGEGVGNFSDLNVARQQAHVAAVGDLKTKLAAVLKLCDEFDTLAQGAYDKAIYGPTVTPEQSTTNQADWSANWQAKLDQMFTTFRGEHPELNHTE